MTTSTQNQQASLPPHSRLTQVELALDLGSHSQVAVDQLHRFVHPHQSSCTLTYVLHPEKTVDQAFKLIQSESHQALRQVVNERFDQYTQILANHQFVVSDRHLIETQDTIEHGLVKHLQASPPDLLVVGTELSTLPHDRAWVISSTAYALASHAPCSVMVIKRPPQSKDTLRVLLATDGSHHAQKAVEQLTRFLPKQNVELFICNVVSLNTYLLPLAEPFVNFGPLEQALQGEAGQLTKETAEFLTQHGYPMCHSFFTIGNPADQIVQEAQEKAVDLIVMGAHGQGNALVKWLLGSVSATVLAHSPTSVAILR